jgi:hypothetical protein
MRRVYSIVPDGNDFESGVIARSSKEALRSQLQVAFIAASPLRIATIVTYPFGTN